jgi:hypothetical protein
MNRSRGFIGLLLMIIAALALANYYFDWSVFEFAKTEKGREVVDYTRDLIALVWSYLSVPVNFIWEKVRELIASR